MTWRGLLLLVLLVAAGTALWWNVLREATWTKYYKRGVAFIQAGEFEDAHTEFLKAVSEIDETGGPGSDDVLADSYLMAANIVEFRLARPQRALELYRKLIDRLPAHPKSIDARLGVARLFTDKLNQPTEGITAYKALLKDWPKDPRLAELPERIVRLYIQTGEFQQAVIEAREFIAADPTRPDAATLLFLTGDALAYLEKFGEALEAYVAVETDYPASPEARVARFEVGNCLLKLGRYSQAAGAFEQALATYPNPDVVRLRIRKAKLLAKQEMEPGKVPGWAEKSTQTVESDEGPALIDPFPEDRPGYKASAPAPSTGDDGEILDDGSIQAEP
jgi:tetratricopeptide (TPR) repeat protein